MKITNDSNYPVTVKGERIEPGDTVDVEIEDVEKYKDDRRFLLEEDDDSDPEPEEEDVSEDDGEEESGDEEISKPGKQKDNTGD